MTRLLNGIGCVLILGGIVMGFIYGFKDDPGIHWLNAFSWWFGGTVSGVLFFAFSLMLEYLEQNNEFLRELLDRTQEQAQSPPSLGNSKASLKSLRGYKMKSSD